MTDQFDIVVACDENRGIGINNQLPWRLAGDLKFFRNLTVGTDPLRNAVIMGRKTWQSLPAKFRPLPERINIVLTSNSRYDLPPTVTRCSSLTEALTCARDLGAHNVFVIGGGQLYAEGLNDPACHRLYVTRIQATFNCDVFLPEFTDRFKLVSSSAPQKENELSYQWEVYEKSN